MTYLFIVICVSAPVLIGVFLFVFQYSLDEEYFEQRFSSLYENIKLNKTSTLLYSSFFTLRRLIFCSSVVFLMDLPSLQLMVYCFTSFFQIMYIAIYRPFID